MNSNYILHLRWDTNLVFGDKIVKRIISALVGIFFIGVVVWFAIKSSTNSKYILPYGLGSALIAPMGLSALGYSIKREDKTLQELTKVTQIDKLIEQAETEAEKIKRLKKEKDQLLDYIKNETKRISKIERKKILEEDAKRILYEYKQVINEINAMPNGEIDLENISEEIQELYYIQNESLNIEKQSEFGLNLVVLGINYMAQGLFDIYRLPAEILVDQIDRFVKILYRGIEKLAKIISNLFRKS